MVIYFSAELLERNIRINVLSPGTIDTPIFERGGGSHEETDGTKGYFASFNPSKRLGLPQKSDG